MKEVKVEKIESYDDLKKVISKMEVGTRYVMPKNFHYKFMRLDTSIDEDNEGYTWTMVRNYYVTGSAGYVFPMLSTNLIKTFKTVNGAKRNLTKYCEFIFK